MNRALPLRCRDTITIGTSACAVIVLLNDIWYNADMKIGLRRPSFRGRIVARTSWKRAVRHRLGVKAPRGWGWVTNPRRAAYNRVYKRVTFDPIAALGKLLRG